MRYQQRMHLTRILHSEELPSELGRRKRRSRAGARLESGGKSSVGMEHSPDRSGSARRATELVQLAGDRECGPSVVGFSHFFALFYDNSDIGVLGFPQAPRLGGSRAISMPDRAVARASAYSLCSCG